jgi:hypothetical protein
MAGSRLHSVLFQPIWQSRVRTVVQSQHRYAGARPPHAARGMQRTKDSKTIIRLSNVPAGMSIIVGLGHVPGGEYTNCSITPVGAATGAPAGTSAGAGAIFGAIAAAVGVGTVAGAIASAVCTYEDKFVVT